MQSLALQEAQETLLMREESYVHAVSIYWVTLFTTGIMEKMNNEQNLFRCEEFCFLFF